MRRIDDGIVCLRRCDYLFVLPSVGCLCVSGKVKCVESSELYFSAF